MSRILFENSKFALGFAAVTLVGAGVLMGTDNSLSGVELEEQGEPAPAPNSQVAAKAQPQAAPAPLPPQPAIADWASDEELIDTAEGFDPSAEETAELVDNSAAPSGGNRPSNSGSSAQARPGGYPEGTSAPPSQAPSTPKGTNRRNGALEVK